MLNCYVQCSVYNVVCNCVCNVHIMNVKLLDLFTGTGSVARVNNMYRGRHHHRMHAWSFPVSPPETSVIAAGRAEGGAAHRHRDADSADCGAAQAANRRRKREGELRASASRPLVQRLHDSPGILMRDSRPPARKEAH